MDVPSRAWLTNTQHLLPSPLLLLRGSTSKSLLQFLTQRYPKSRALILEKKAEAKEELKKQNSLRDEPGNVEEGPPHSTAGQQHAFWTSPPFLTHVLHSLPWWHPGQTLCSQFISPAVYCGTRLKDTSCWHFQMIILFIFTIILVCVAPTVVNGAIQSLQIRHAIYLNIAVNLTGCIYGVWIMFFLFCSKFTPLYDNQVLLFTSSAAAK